MDAQPEVEKIITQRKAISEDGDSSYYEDEEEEVEAEDLETQS